jgi:hypothetical protein
MQTVIISETPGWMEWYFKFDCEAHSFFLIVTLLMNVETASVV